MTLAPFLKTEIGAGEFCVKYVMKQGGIIRARNHIGEIQQLEHDRKLPHNLIVQGKTISTFF